MNDLRKAAQDLLEGVEAAIEAGVWKVDGACDPDSVIVRLRKALAEPEHESAYAGVRMWIGGKNIEYWVSKTCIEHEAIEGMSMSMAANSCLQALKENKHD